ncbi:MAG: triose-phosphate isomerase [Bacteroidetes bacterium]|jgi:triosephosphate isomerase|nr:triose-phosphate isomerase [Bacteroidota bacterium]
MRRNLVLGNWKQNTTKESAVELLDAIKLELEKAPTSTDLGVIPPALFIEMATEEQYSPHFSVGIQNISKTQKGAFTGEIGADMAASASVKYALVGHSERRAYFNESNQDLAQKIERCIENNIVAVFCVGEELKDRKSGNYLEVVKQQVNAVLAEVKHLDIEKLVIAYEPVWAIGTGETATAEQAQEVHAMIRSLVNSKLGSNDISILYGGSCKPSNAKELFIQPDIDGGLIGGAALNAQDFVAIANSF